jgi:hypothetical protein
MNPTPIQLLQGLATEVNLALDELAGPDRRRAKERILPFFAQLEHHLSAPGTAADPAASNAGGSPAVPGDR